MGGFFGTVSTKECTNDLFYGTDYNSHLGTMRGGMSTYSKENGFIRSIHNLESTYFRSAFEDTLDKFKGKSGIGIISDTDAQPLLFNSHLGRFAIVTVAKVNNKEELADKLLNENMHLAEFSSGKINQTELIGLLIVKGKTFVEGIERGRVHSCSSPRMASLPHAIHGGALLSSSDIRKVHTLPQANRRHSLTWGMKSRNTSDQERLSDYMPTMLSNCVSRTRVCRYVRSSGCIMVSQHRHTKVLTLRMCAISAEK